MLISVIIPTYNNNDELIACLKAISSQTIGRHEFEVIVVDNGSRVSALTVCQDFSFVRCIIEKKPGSYSARNAGCRNARGDILGFTDADCIPDSEWLERARNKFLEGAGDISAFGGAIHVTTDKAPNTAELYEKNFALRQKKYVLKDGYAATANLFVRKHTFQEVGQFNAELLSGGDREWGARYRAMGNTMCYMDDVIIYHPARATILSLVRKRRRVTGGVRTLKSRHLDSIKSNYENEGPGKVSLIFKPGRFGLSILQGWRVFFLWAILGGVECGERIRLRLGGKAVR